MTKQTLTPKDISQLADILEDCATIRIELETYYWVDPPKITYTPRIRVQSIKHDLLSLKEEYGGSFHENPYTHKQTWVWNMQMIKAYLPTLIPHLSNKTKEKAEIVLEATKYCYGRGIEQDKDRLKELYEKLQKLQEPRIRKPSIFRDSFHFY
jgi:hypothetical protein